MSTKPDFLKISKLKQKPACMAPWTNLYAKVTPTGYNAKVCCVSEDSVDVKNISEYLESDMLKETTSALEKGQLPPGCIRCKKDFDNDPAWEVYEQEILKVKRKNKILNDKKDYESLDVNDLKKILKNDDDKFIQIDLRPGNLCNLKCRMCNASSSTEIAKEGLKILDDTEFVDKLQKADPSASHLGYSYSKEYHTKYTKDYTKSDEHREKINKIFEYANLRRLKLLGGEPSIDPAIISTMEDLKQNKFKLGDGFRLQITTNMTNINKNWLDYFKYFNAKVTASIDGAGRTFEYIRYPAKWSTIKKNLEVVATDESHDLSMNLVMSSILFLDIKHWIPELNALALQKNFKLNFIECFYPTYMMPNTIPYEYRLKILDDIKQLMNYDLSSNIRVFLIKCGEYLESFSGQREVDINLLKTFFLINMKQDQLRKQNIFDINYTKDIYEQYEVEKLNDRSK